MNWTQSIFIFSFMLIICNKTANAQGCICQQTTTQSPTTTMPTIFTPSDECFAIMILNYTNPEFLSNNISIDCSNFYNNNNFTNGSQYCFQYNSSSTTTSISTRKLTTAKELSTTTKTQTTKETATMKKSSKTSTTESATTKKGKLFPND